MTRAELTHMIELAKRLIAAGEPGVLSTLFSSNGSTYRPLGSMMVSGLPTMLAGGISGGCLEQYVARTARSLTQEQPAAMLSFDADPDHDDGAKPVLVRRLNRSAGSNGWTEAARSFLNFESFQRAV